MFGRKVQKTDVAPTQIDVATASARALHNPLYSKSTVVSLIDQSSVSVLNSIESSFFIIDDIRDTVVEAGKLLLQAVKTDDTAMRALLAERYDDLRESIETKIKNADESAQKLIGEDAETLIAKLNGTATYSIRPVCLDVSEKGLDLPPPTQAFEDLQEIAAIMDSLEKAIVKITKVSTFYMKDAKFLISRLEQHA